jgi:hypothetical protein
VPESDAARVRQLLREALVDAAAVELEARAA